MVGSGRKSTCGQHPEKAFDTIKQTGQEYQNIPGVDKKWQYLLIGVYSLCS